MTDINRVQLVQYGNHSSTTDLSAVPGSLVSLDCEEADVLPRDVNRLERNLYRDDNAEYADVIAEKGLDELSLGLLLRGVANNTGGALVANTATEVGRMMESMMGAAATDPTNTGTTITADTGALGTLTVTAGTNYANGVGILFMDGNGEYIARELVSGGGTTTLTLDRNHVDGAPGSDNIPYRSVYWTLAPSVSMHTHGFIRARGANWERSYFGCAGSLRLSMKEKEAVKFQTKWRPTNWTDTTVAAAYSAPSAGDYVMGLNSKMYIGSDAVLLKGCDIDLGYTIAPRETASSANGLLGYMVTRKQPVIEGSLYFGVAGLSFGEIADSTGNISLNKIQGLTASAGTALAAGQVESTYDVGIQFGAGPGRTLYVRCPAASFRGRLVVENGIEMCKFSLRPRRPSSGSMMRIHLF